MGLVPPRTVHLGLPLKDPDSEECWSAGDWVPSQGREGPGRKGMLACSRLLAWAPWTEGLDGLLRPLESPESDRTGTD